MRRDQLAKLTKHTEFAYGWFGISFFHLRRVTELKSHANHFFLCFNQDFYGMAVLRMPSFGILNCSLCTPRSNTPANCSKKEVGASIETARSSRACHSPSER